MNWLFLILLIISYTLSTLIFIVGYGARTAFFLIWTSNHEIIMMSSIVISQLLHYLIYWRACNLNVLNDSFSQIVYIIDLFIYGGNLLLLILILLASNLSIIELQIPVSYTVPNAILNSSALAVRIIAHKTGDSFA